MNSNAELDALCVNTIRLLAADAVQQAESGHPGMPMGMAAVAYTLWSKHLKHNPRQPKWADRDRFVLSAGHGSMLLYALLHLFGYDLSLDELKKFRQWGSRTPGHPESAILPGVEATTGPLGQGAGNSVGMAMAERWLAAKYNKPNYEIVNHFTYALVSDGDLMEGVCAEAASLAGHLKLGKLIWLYDDNGITIDGTTKISFSEDVAKRFEAYGWHTQKVDGFDMDAVSSAIAAAQAVTDKPSLICCKTVIGFGSPNMKNTSKIHGSPLGKDELKETKKNLGFNPEESFVVPEAVANECRKAIEAGSAVTSKWNALFEAYSKNYPELADQWSLSQSGKLPEGWKSDMPVFKPEDGKVATRSAFGKALNAYAPKIPWLIGGSADLEASTDTGLKGETDFLADNPSGRMLRFGIREHAMGAIMNGMVYHGGIKPFGSTFLVFSDYMRPSVRVAAIAELNPIYIWTHDSIGVGEDGPTHQPVEQFAALRCIPNLTLIRPSDANETSIALAVAIEHEGGPVALLLTRQKLPVIDRTKYAGAEGLLKGAYIIAGSANEVPQLIIIATGSEVSLALASYEKLAEEGIKTRVVAMPSWELFEKQSAEYKESVLPKAVKARLAVEAARSMGWEKYIGESGDMIAVDKFGTSAPIDVVMEKYGYSVDNIIAKAKALL